MKIKLSPFIVRKSVTGIESMDFCSAPVRFRFLDPHWGFFVFCACRDFYWTATMLKLFLKSRNNRRLLVPLINRGRWPSGKETIKMPIMLTGKDGPPTPFRNTEYIPFYYFILKSMKCTFLCYFRYSVL